MHDTSSKQSVSQSVSRVAYSSSCRIVSLSLMASSGSRSSSRSSVSTSSVRSIGAAAFVAALRSVQGAGGTVESVCRTVIFTRRAFYALVEEQYGLLTRSLSSGLIAKWSARAFRWCGASPLSTTKRLFTDTRSTASRTHPFHSEKRVCVIQLSTTHGLDRAGDGGRHLTIPVVQRSHKFSGRPKP